MRKSILITGAGGFVGSHLAQGYLRLGHHVTALDQHFDELARRRTGDAAIVSAPLNRQTLSELPGRFDLVIHGAAVTTSPASAAMTDAGQIRLNLDLLLDCLDFAASREVEAFVFLSSSGVFTVADARDALLETTVPTGTSAYAVAKRCGELIVAATASEGRRMLTARLGYLYGPGEVPRATRKQVSLVRQWLCAAEAGEPILVTTPGLARDWTFAGDLTGALEAVLGSRERHSLVHLGCGVAVTDAHLAAEISKLLPETLIDHATSKEAQFKAPMASLYPCEFTWTPLERGLDLTVGQEERS